MKRTTVTLPKKRKDTGEWSTREVPFDKIMFAVKHNIDAIPEIIGALKKADNEGWQQVFDEMAVYLDSKPHYAELVRRAEKDGREAISIGEPNWIYAPLLFVMGAFSVGFIIGSACVAADPCMFVD